MHCPKCNTQLAPGNVYCPKCGQEVQIVPDYDPLDEVLLDGTDNNEKQKNAKELAETSEKKRKKKSFGGYLLRWWRDPVLRKITLVCFGLLLCAIVALIAYLFVRRQNDYTYQLREGMEYYENKQWEDAIISLRRAYELQKDEYRDDERPVLFLARIYKELGELDMATELMERLLDFPMGEKQKLELYEELFLIMQENGEADRINELIGNCKEELIMKRLQPYRIEQPTVNLSGGVYHYYIYPKLEAAYGSVYYTLDGSTPTKDSAKYNGRLELMEGENLLTAVAINEKGIVSEPLFVVYKLDFDVPEDTSNKNDSVSYQ